MTEPHQIRDKNVRVTFDRHEAFFLHFALQCFRTGATQALPLLDINRDLEEKLEVFLMGDPRDGSKRDAPHWKRP